MTLSVVFLAILIFFVLGWLSFMTIDFWPIGLTFFALAMFLTLLLGVNDGNGYPAFDKDVNSLPACTLMQSEAMGKLKGENGKLMPLYAIKERESRGRPRLYLLDDINLPILFVKTPKGEYVTYPNPGKDVLLGCGK